ncbi:MAG: hypothetical protein PHC97_03340 [Patescibacteria group bacterium]|nr:hypothetical protein [Patescibacteria group bacterium]
MRKTHKTNIFLSKQSFMIFLVFLGMVGIAVSVLSKEQFQIASTCSTSSVSSATLVRTYHLRDNTDGFDILPTKDGGYLLAGDTIASSGMAIPNPFLIKTDSKGNLLWSRQFSSKSLPPRDSSTSHEPHITVETADGGIVTASDIVDFIDAKYEKVLEVSGDILVTKINAKGTQTWSVMLGNYSVDRPQKMWALSDNSVILLARLAQTGYGFDVADIDAVPKYSALITIDKNGKVTSLKKMNWEAVDMERLSDGGFIALAKIALPETQHAENVVGPEVSMGDLPTVIKLNSGLNTEWAKTLEMIPSEINAPTSYENGLTIGKTVIRIMGGDFRAVQPTADGGFLAIGFDNLLLTRGLNSGVGSQITSFTPRPFIAVKIDAAGNYQWAKKLTINLTSSTTGNDFQVVKTADNNFVIMQDIVRDSTKVDSKDLAVLAKALASNIELIKVDSEFNPIWIKKFDLERDLSGFNIAPTADKGVVVSGSMLTTKMHKVLLSMEPYKEAALIKVDANGGVSACVFVTDYREATLEDRSQYLVVQNMSVGVSSDATLSVNKKVAEKVWAISDTARNICLYKKIAVTPTCSFLTPANPASATGGQSNIPPTAKTWPQINFENATSGKIETEKSQQINQELLPILNQLFNNQVKMTDNTSGLWLTYYFPRQTTRADVEAVQRYYEGLGYKIDESEGGNLWVSRIGLTLHLTFSIQNSMVGKLEVLF